MEIMVDEPVGRLGFWASAVAVACVALCMLWKHHPRYGGNPGLPSFPIVGSLPLILLNKHRFYEWSCEVFESAHALTHLVFMGSHTTVVTADPQNVHHILKSCFEIYPKGPNFYPYFDDIFGKGIFNSDGPLWRFQRKVASHIFTSNSLKDFVVEIADVEICSRLIPALDFACKNPCGRPLDLQALFMDFTFDSISQLTFGTDPARLVRCKFIKTNVDEDVKHVELGISGCKSSQIKFSDIPTNGPSFLSHEEGGGICHASERDSDVAFMKVPDDLIQEFSEGFPISLHIIANRFLTPKFVWKTKRWLNIGSERKLRHALKAVNKFAGFVIEKSKNECSGRKDLLAMFMQLSKMQVASLLEGEDEAIWKANSDEHGQALSDSLLKDVLLSFILAGRDTVASGVTFLIWQICLYPEVEEAIYEEIKRIIKDRHRSDQVGFKELGTFSYEELRRMYYLHAALSESMRLYPPVPSNPKYAAQDNVLPDGTKVHEGNEVSYNVFAMGRARKVWGDDCLTFKPERWLGEDGVFIPVSPFRYPVFQAGLRTCLGKDFAYIQIKLVVASLVRDYKFSLSPGFKPKLSFGVNMSMTNGLPVMVQRRK